MAAPSAAPARAPAKATIRNSTRASATTLVPVAPIALRIASDARLRSTKPCAALATPTPPTTSDNKPDSVRNSAKRSRSRVKSGETLRRVRVSQPACGNVLLALSRRACTAASSGAPPGPSMTTRVVQRTSEPGCTRPVASSAACEMSTRGPRPMPTPRRSGSLFTTALRTNLVSPRRKTSPILRLRRASSVSSAAAPNAPSLSASASAGVICGSNSAAPIAARTARPP